MSKSTLFSVVKNVITLGVAAALLSACVGYVVPAPGKVWVPAHYGRFGQWIPAHWRR